jgi:putative chitinase
MERKLFFDQVRSNNLFKTLSVEQVENVEAILNQCQDQGIDDKRQIAYILATAYLETGVMRDGKLVRMLPVEEIGKGRGRKYGSRVWYNGTPYMDVPHIYYGRGHTQNSWRDNYVALTKAAKKQGKDWDFEHHPELLLQTEPSAWATVYAMKVGLYTGRKLSDYIGAKTDFINARKIINGLDKAELIKSYAVKFLDSMD